MIVVFNPYFLDGIAYKYDSPGMGISILFPLVPFLFINTARLYTISSLACVVGVYLSYQSSSGIYVMMVIFIALLKYITEEWTLGEAAKFCARSAAAFLLATMLSFGVLRLLISPGARHRSMEISIGSNAIKNIVLYFSSIQREFNVLWKALGVLVMIAAALAACRLSKKKLWATLPLFAVALLIAFALSQGGFVFLVDYAGAARYKYGFGALLAILASVSVLGLPSLGALWKKALAAAPAVLLSWSFFSYASAFGNAHANQMKMELQYEALARQDINELFPREEYPRLEIGFVGQMPWSGEVKNLAMTYPITEALVQRRYGKVTGFISGRTMTYFDPTVMPADHTDFTLGDATLILERRYYNLLLEEGTGRVIVECRMKEN